MTIVPINGFLLLHTCDTAHCESDIMYVSEAVLATSEFVHNKLAGSESLCDFTVIL